VNGVDCGPIPAVDSAGRALPQWRADRVLAADELLAGSTLPRSFDGRFFGTIERADVMGVYRRVAVGVASTVTTDPSVVGHPTKSPSPAELRDQPIRPRRPRARMEEIVMRPDWGLRWGFNRRCALAGGSNCWRAGWSLAARGDELDDARDGNTYGSGWPT
jgi:hypothetical protein